VRCSCPAPPGIRYEATCGRKTVKSKTFIGRVYERVNDGGMQLWACDHKHPAEAESLSCAVAEARAIGARTLADYRPPDVRVLRGAQEFGGMPVEFRDPPGDGPNGRFDHEEGDDRRH
jgi:hypothetical protein